MSHAIYTLVYDLCLQNISCLAAVIHYVHENQKKNNFNGWHPYCCYTL